MESNIYQQHLQKEFKLNLKNVEITLAAFMFIQAHMKQQLTRYTILLYHPQENVKVQTFYPTSNHKDWIRISYKPSQNFVE